MKKEFNHLVVKIKSKIDKTIEEGYRLSKGKGLSEYERDYIIKCVIDKKVNDGIQDAFEEMQSITTDDVELINDIEELKLEIEMYCKKKLKLK